MTNLIKQIETDIARIRREHANHKSVLLTVLLNIEGWSNASLDYQERDKALDTGMVDYQLKSIAGCVLRVDPQQKELYRVVMR